MVSICNTTIWQVDCLGDYQGVEPLQPPETQNGFPLVETLRPLLEWKPAKRPEVTYDVAIYESLTLSYATLDKEMLHGPLVRYAEGLKEPRYVPPMPLAPGKRYTWLVRLRDKDVVSTWSTSREQGLFGVVRHSGRTFGFTTPSRPGP